MNKTPNSIKTGIELKEMRKEKHEKKIAWFEYKKVWGLPLLSGPGDGPAPTIPGIVAFCPGHLNQSCLQRYPNPAN